MHDLATTHVLILIAAVAVAVLTVAALITTLLDRRRGVGAQVAWTLALILLPVAGLVAWSVDRGVRRHVPRRT